MLDHESIIAEHLAHCSDPEPSVDNFTSRGTHVGCGACCSRVLPVTDNEVALIRDYCEVHDISFFAESLGIADMRCPLLDRTSMSCLVYDVRPTICRAFSCDLPPDDVAKHLVVEAQANPNARMLILGKAEHRDLRHELAAFEVKRCDIACILADGPDISKHAAYMVSVLNVDDPDADLVLAHGVTATPSGQDVHLHFAYAFALHGDNDTAENRDLDAIEALVLKLDPNADDPSWEHLASTAWACDLDGKRIELFDLRKHPFS